MSVEKPTLPLGHEFEPPPPEADACRYWSGKKGDHPCFKPRSAHEPAEPEPQTKFSVPQQAYRCPRCQGTFRCPFCSFPADTAEGALK